MRCSLAWKFNLISSINPLSARLIFSIVSIPRLLLANFWLIDWLNEWRISAKWYHNRKDRRDTYFVAVRMGIFDTCNYCLDDDPLRGNMYVSYHGRIHLFRLRWSCWIRWMSLSLCYTHQRLRFVLGQMQNHVKICKLRARCRKLWARPASPSTSPYPSIRPGSSSTPLGFRPGH